MFVVVYLGMLIAATATVTVSGLQSELSAGTVLSGIVMLVGYAQVLLVAAVSGLAMLQVWRGYGQPNRKTGKPDICRWEPEALGGATFGRHHPDRS